MFDLSGKDLLGLTVLAAIVTTLGNLIATVLKEFVFARWLETWKSRRSERAAWDRYRVPMCAASIELMRRIEDIYRDFPRDYLFRAILDERVEYFKINDRTDPHYRRYKLISTLYRFCCFLGWVELYRREVVTLPGSATRKRTELEQRLAAVRVSLADGQIQTADDWESWTDRLIFREELRALGELMIDHEGKVPSLIGYSKFCAMFDDASFKRWADLLLNFFLLDGGGEKDFRKERLRRLIIDLYLLVLHLDKDQLPQDCLGWDKKYAPRNQPRNPEQGVVI